MTEKIKKLLLSVGIEYFAVLDYGDCRVSSVEIMGRESFEPRSVIIYLVPYYGGECVNLSRYAASLDYHLAIGEINTAISGLLSDNFPSSHSKGYGDHSPIDERHAALISGLGFVGDNGLLINEKYGSYVFIGDLITDIPPEQLGAESPKPVKHCHGCGACNRACPTGILRGEGTDCLSAITQRKGELCENEAELMRKYNTAWGCDLCQSVCPYNAEPVKTPVEFFYRDRIECLTEDTLAAMDKSALRARAFGWRGRAVLERNLEILGAKED